MERELIINSTPDFVEIALIEESKLVEFHKESVDNSFSVGDVYLGRVKSVVPGHNSAFVDVGYEKNAFLHYSDLGHQLRSLQKYVNIARNDKKSNAALDGFKLEKDIDKNGKIVDVLKKNQIIPVQILKEPISTKGPRLTCEMAIAGRYMVIIPFSDSVSVSKKIQDSEERKRLSFLIESIKPKQFGVITRTAAEGKSVAVLHEEMKSLLDRWGQMYEDLKSATPPVKLLNEVDKASVLIRDILNDTFNTILVGDKAFYKKMKSYLSKIAPQHLNILKLYGGKTPIFQHYGVNKQIKSSFGSTITLKSGAYIIIEHTEAMHVIDVNSGPKLRNNSQEESAVAVNLECAKEIARQLRLRDLGGLIIVDFIDMKKAENKKLVYNEMKQQMKNDRAQHTVLTLSRFGLMQITRQRTKPAIEINTEEKCHLCQGTGKIQSSSNIVENIERDLNYVINSGNKAKISIHLHPYIYSFLKHGLPSPQMKWFTKYGKWIKLIKNDIFGITEYKFKDEEGDEIRLN